MRHLILIAGMILLLSGAALGTTYYVATNGSDSNPGSQSQPWLTLQHAVQTIAAGDTIIVLPGTYAGCRIELTGTSGAPKTIMAQTPGSVTLNALGPINRHNRIFEIENYNAAVNYWVVDGFTVDGGNTIGGIDSRSTATQMNNNITIQNCTVHNAKNGTSVCTGLFSAFTNYALIQHNTSYSNTEHGCYTNNSCDNGVVRGNVWYSNASLGHHMNGDKSQGGDGQMTGWLIEKNISYNNGSNGYDADGVSSSTWKNNLAYGNVSKAIQMTQVDGTSNPANDRILNNTFLTPVGGYYVCNWIKGRSKVGGTNNAIINNILYHADFNNSMRGSIDYVSTWEPTLTSDYNVVVDHFAMNDNKNKYTLATWRSTFGQDLHSVLCTDVNALFVNPAANNYHLLSTSPAKDAGTTLADVTDDLEGTSRPQGVAYDVGCYEYH